MPEVRLELTCQDFERSRLAYAVLPHDASDPARPWDGQPVESEAVATVAMYALSLELLRQVDDEYRFERTLVNADTTPAAQIFRDHRAQRSLIDDNCLIASAHSGAVALALKRTFLRMTPVAIYDGYPWHAINRPFIFI
jgi:hypothetical protein